MYCSCLSIDSQGKEARSRGKTKHTKQRQKLLEKIIAIPKIAVQFPRRHCVDNKKRATKLW